MGAVPHLYLHVPFCHRICPYCSFYKHQPGGTDQGAFLDAIVAETERRANEMGDALQLSTIYWGGGTPSLLSVKHLESFLPRFLKALGNPSLQEWTVEMNPKSLTAEKLALLRAHGVTRASLGVQAWDVKTLETLGRDHSPNEAGQAFAALRAAGFPVVSLDLMFSIPGQSVGTWIGSLERSIALQPDHISSYNLTYEEDTEFFQKFERGEYQRDEATDEAFFLEAMQRLEAAGFAQYEISNYARPGFESAHNSGYWTGNDYLGIGPSAVSTINRVRTKNVSDTNAYMALAGKAWSAAAEMENLTDEQWRCERIALELRTRKGLAIEMLGDSAPKLPALEEAGLVQVLGNRVLLTRRGKLVADSVVEHLWAA